MRIVGIDNKDFGEFSVLKIEWKFSKIYSVCIDFSGEELYLYIDSKDKYMNIHKNLIGIFIGS
jgi:hypothetical protein